MRRMYEVEYRIALCRIERVGLCKRWRSSSNVASSEGIDCLLHGRDVPGNAHDRTGSLKDPQTDMAQFIKMMPHHWFV